MSKYRKLFVALSGVLATLGTVLADGAVVSSEYEALIFAALTAYGVYRVPNSPNRPS